MRFSVSQADGCRRAARWHCTINVDGLQPCQSRRRAVPALARHCRGCIATGAYCNTAARPEDSGLQVFLEEKRPLQSGQPADALSYGARCPHLVIDVLWGFSPPRSQNRALVPHVAAYRLGRPGASASFRPGCLQHLDHQPGVDLSSRYVFAAALPIDL